MKNMKDDSDIPMTRPKRKSSKQTPIKVRRNKWLTARISEMLHNGSDYTKVLSEEENILITKCIIQGETEQAAADAIGSCKETVVHKLYGTRNSVFSKLKRHHEL